MDPCFETATRLARAIRNGRLSSVEATKSASGAHRASQCAAQCLGGGRPRRRHEGRPRRRSRPREGQGGRQDGGPGPLNGVPITIKEAFDVNGLATTSSHPPLEDNVAREDATLVGRLRAAGAVILGKTNVPELCADFQTDSPLFGTTKNAWDQRRTAGGSTGGGAVAVAARLSPLEIGSDIGGSVRNPAHYNGIFALKPTEWRVPGRGHVPDLPGRTRTTRYMGVFGPLARSVEDLEAALRIIAGPDGHDAEVPPVPLGPTPVLKPRDLRIAVLESNPLVQGVGRHGGRGAGDGAAADESRRQGEAGRTRRAGLAAGLGRLVRSLPLSEPRPAAAQRARAHLRRWASRPIRRRARRRGRRGSTWRNSSPSSIAATASCASARPSSTTTMPG